MLGGIGGAGKLGMGGLTGSAVGGGGAAGALSVWFGMPALFAAGSVLVAALGTYWSGWYLLRFAETARETAGIHRFMLTSTLTSVIVCGSTLLLNRLSNQPWSALLVLCAGMVVINYQTLRVLPRVMRPMLERDAQRRGTTQAPLLYRCMFSPARCS